MDLLKVFKFYKLQKYTEGKKLISNKGNYDIKINFKLKNCIKYYFLSYLTDPGKVSGQYWGTSLDPKVKGLAKFPKQLLL